MFARIAAAFAIVSVSVAAFAASGDIVISNKHVRPTAGSVGVAFFTVTSPKNDAITGVMSDCCKAVELHRSEMINGIMSMRRIGTLTLDKNKPREIQPGSKTGEHLMLIGLDKPLTEEDAVTVTFSFKHAPSQTVSFPVMADADAENDKAEHH